MQDINHLGQSSRTTGEAETIRALLMGIDRLLRGSSVATLVAAPIEHIHRSLDRIESADRREPERRRPGRAEYFSTELITMSRQPARAGSDQTTGKDKPEQVPTRAPQKISYRKDAPSAILMSPVCYQSLTIGVLAFVG